MDFTFNGDTLEVDGENGRVLLTVMQAKGIHPEDREATMQLGNKAILDLALHLLHVLEISRSK